MKTRIRLSCICLCMLMLFSSFLMASCGDKNAKVINVGYQEGVGSTVFIVMAEKGFIDEFLPDGYTVNFTTLSGGGTAMREALSVGSLDVGMMGTPPVVIGADKKLPIGIICGIAASPCSFLTNKPSIKTLSDVGDDKIAILAYGSIQQIYLSMIADQVFGDATYFDKNIVTLAESEAYVAMDSGAEISCYFGLNPTKTRIKNLESVHEITSTSEYDLKISSLIACINTDYAAKNPEVAKSFKNAIESTLNWMKDNQEEVIDIVSKKLNISKEILTEVYSEEQFDTNVYGYDDCAQYMKQLDIISNDPQKLEDMIVK